MKFLLDTNVCVQYLRGKNTQVQSHFRSHRLADLSVCSIVVAELRYGAAHSKNPPQETAKVDAFLAPLKSLPFDDDAAVVYGTIQAQLRLTGTLISEFDACIAAIALYHDLTVVTHNTREFGRVPTLRLVDWEVP